MQPSQNQAVIGSLDRFLEVFDRLLSKGAIAFSCIQESLSLLLPTSNLLFKIFLRRLLCRGAVTNSDGSALHEQGSADLQHLNRSSAFQIAICAHPSHNKE